MGISLLRHIFLIHHTWKLCKKQQLAYLLYFIFPCKSKHTNIFTIKYGLVVTLYINEAVNDGEPHFVRTC